MSQLLLLRHAKARWAAPGTRDFDRPLDPAGVADAGAIGAAMLKAGYLPDKVICSSAARARDTWNAAALHLKVRDVEFTDGLYSSDAAGYLEIIHRAYGDGSLLVVGHNPMMEDLALALPRDGLADALASVAAGFPTAGLAVMNFSAPLSRIALNDGYLEAFLTPRDI